MKRAIIISLITALSILSQSCTEDKDSIDNDIIKNEEMDNSDLRRSSSGSEMSQYVYYVLIDYLDGVSPIDKFNAKTTFEYNASHPIYNIYNGVAWNQEVWLIASEDLWVINTLIVPLPQVDDYYDTSVFKVFYTEEGLEDREAAREFLIDFVVFDEQEDYDICIHPGCCTDNNTDNTTDSDGVIEYVELISNEDFKD